MYPNLSVLLKLPATLPVPSCECERSFSVLQPLQTWLRASMTTKRPSSLAIINIQRGVQIDYKSVVKIFLELLPRKLNVSNLIYLTRSKYVVSLPILDIPIFVLQPLTGPFFSSLSTRPRYFLPTCLI